MDMLIIFVVMLVTFVPMLQFIDYMGKTWGGWWALATIMGWMTAYMALTLFLREIFK